MLLWLLTTGLQFAVGWWYRKQPVFFLPQGWFGPLGWWLALPFAPAGTFFFPCAARYNPIRATRLCHVAGPLMNSRQFRLISPRVSNNTQCVHRFHLFSETHLSATIFTGSVSVGVWQIACRRLIVVGEKAVKGFAGKYILPPSLSFFFLIIIPFHYLSAPQLESKNDVSISSLAPTPNNTPRKGEKNADGRVS